MSVATDANVLGRERIRRVFQYLAALNELGNPPVRVIEEQPWRLWLRELPNHPVVKRGMARDISGGSGDADEDAGEDGDELNDISADESFFLKVGRPAIAPCPKPPQALDGWVQDGWDKPDGHAEFRPTVDRAREKEETKTLRFDDDTERIEAFNRWAGQRTEWIDREKPAFAALNLYERLYELYGRIEREAERVELVLGDGVLRWMQKDGAIDHPLLLQRLQLKFDTKVPEFIIIETDHPVELYTAILRTLADVDQRVIATCRSELSAAEFHPADGAVTSGFFKAVVVRLSARGEFADRPTSNSALTTHPVLCRDPVIFLRARSLGFATALEGVIEDLGRAEELPQSLLHIVGIDNDEGIETPVHEDKTSSPFANEDEKVLLTKPANSEQVRIARTLERHGCVLVQGPPGTGKTHTIANLIGHLLAQGKSVLVTSHTTKALRVLRDKVAAELQPLCVSVLESDEEGRRQLEASVQTIVRRLSESNADELQTESDTFAAERLRILGKLRDVREALRRARLNEYRDIVVAGQSIAPSSAARAVAAGVNRHDWIPGPVNPGSSTPLGLALLLDLYRTNTSLTDVDELESTGVLPNLLELPKPHDYQELANEYAAAKLLNRDLKAALWNVKAPAGPETIHLLQRLEEDLIKSVSDLADEKGQQWHLEVIAAGTRGGVYREPWNALVAMISALTAQAATAQQQLLMHGPELAADQEEAEQRELLRSIVSHLEGGGRLGFLTLLLKPSWKAFLPRLKLGRSAPTTIAHFKALLSLAELRLARRDLCDRWNRQVVPLGGPSAEDFGDQPERTALQYVDKIHSLLDWSISTWNPAIARLTAAGFEWNRFLADVPPKPGNFGDLLRLAEAVRQQLPPLIAARIAKIRFDNAANRLRNVINQLAPPTSGPAAGVTVTLRQAAASGRVKEYELAFNRLTELTRFRTDAERRRQLLIQLENAAPGWAAAIRDRRSPHHLGIPPGEIGPAWLWRQYHDELEARGKTSQHELQQEIETLNEQLMATTTSLVDRRAWAAQIRRTRGSQQRALQGWLQTIKRIGKGTGKRVPQLRAEAKVLMDQCRTAVPVWIMPLARVVESFKPGNARFDVVIVDEASQSSVTELIAFYFGRQVVVVGDDKQVSPDAVGQLQSEVDALIQEHLTGIPNSHLYDGKLSLYDLAIASFGGMIPLWEHFRCANEIIQFSNYLSYNGQIRPVRDVSNVSTRPHVVPHRVMGTSNNKLNEVEAITIASLIAAACKNSDYAGKTFGVVSLVGNEQAERVEALLRQHLTPPEFAARRILCGNPAQFQGDERDVVFLSVVDGTGDGPLAMRADDRFTKRFNVAASRAKDQMWVVYSLDPDKSLKPGDLRRQLIEHALDPLARTRAIANITEKAESEFERLVLTRLAARGFKVIPQVKVGYYRIDMVVEGGGTRLAIECDGDRYHPADKMDEDIARQAVLERLGWRFVRIRGSQFFRDPDAAMIPVWTKLEQLGIFREATPNIVAPAVSEQQDALVREAEELRRTWAKTESGADEAAEVTAGAAEKTT